MKPEKYTSIWDVLSHNKQGDFLNVCVLCGYQLSRSRVGRGTWLQHDIFTIQPFLRRTNKFMRQFAPRRRGCIMMVWIRALKHSQLDWECYYVADLHLPFWLSYNSIWVLFNFHQCCNPLGQHLHVSLCTKTSTNLFIYFVSF